MDGPIVPPGAPAGGLTAEWAERLGLREGTPVAAEIIDAHAAVPGCGVSDAHEMVLVMGTSTCHMLMSDQRAFVPGVAGVIEDGILPGFYGYEAGQACVGDHFAWLVRQGLPESYVKEAAERGLDAHQLLTEKAAKQKPGEHGLLALDWWNGNRSILMDADLSGVMLGFSLATKPEDMYRALIEATAFGTRVIVEAFEAGGVPVKGLVACGGLAAKNEMLMQIYADILGRPIRVAAAEHTSALGAAILGAVAAAGKGGHATLDDATKHMVKPPSESFEPIAGNVKVYDAIYAEYKALHDYFGKGGNDVLKRLRGIRSGGPGMSGERTAKGTPVTHMWACGMPDASKPVLGLPVLDRARHVVIYEATRETGAYNHHARLAHIGGRFYGMWSNHPGGEDEPGQRVLWSSSDDGQEWVEWRELFPPPGEVKLHDRIGVFLTASRWVPVGDRLFAVASVRSAIGFEDLMRTAVVPVRTDEFRFLARRRHSPIAREVFADGSLGPIFALGENLPDDMTLDVMPGTDGRVVDDVTAIHAAMRRIDRPPFWTPDERGPLPKAVEGHDLCEPTAYRARDGSSCCCSAIWPIPTGCTSASRKTTGARGPSRCRRTSPIHRVRLPRSCWRTARCCSSATRLLWRSITPKNSATTAEVRWSSRSAGTGTCSTRPMRSTIRLSRTGCRMSAGADSVLSTRALWCTTACSTCCTLYVRKTSVSPRCWWRISSGSVLVCRAGPKGMGAMAVDGLRFVGKVMFLLALVFGFVGIVLFAIGYSFYEDAMAVSGWPTTTGTITSSRVVSQTERDRRETRREYTYYRAEVEYRYTVDGQRYTSDDIGSSGYRTTDRQEIESTVAQYPVGETVTVYYDPEKPERAVLTTETSWVDYMVMVMGLFFMAVAVGLYFGSRALARKRSDPYEDAFAPYQPYNP